MPSNRPLPSHFMRIPEAGLHYFGLGVNASYKAAQRGDLVVVEIGNRLLVSVPAMEERLKTGWRRPHAETVAASDEQHTATAAA
jgi:hypothetical protein